MKPPAYGVGLADSPVREAPLPSPLRAGLEGLAGIDLSGVRVHYDSPRPAAMQAAAYTHGQHIHVGPGEERHLPHEGWHAVQQLQGRVPPTTRFAGGPGNDDPGLEREADAQAARAAARPAVSGARGLPAVAPRPGPDVVQGYFKQHYYFSGTNWLVSDDMTMAVEVGYPNHQLYAKSGKAAASNTKLAAKNSGIELVQTGTTTTFWEGSIFSPTLMQKMHKIEPKNKQNGTQGDNMLLYADCGRSAGVVLGSTDREAVFAKPGTGAETRVQGSPAAMKAAVMHAWLQHEKASANPAKALRIDLALNQANTLALGLPAIEADYAAATTDAEREVVAARWHAKIDEIAEALWSFYNTLPEAERETIDKALEINKYAKPEVGQGYTTSSGGAPVPGKRTWNFHWGGLVMTSDDAKDNVVLENYATGDPDEENKLWTFDMYGTEKKGQTFHEKHAATGQHGQTPTTMVVEKKP